MKTPPGGRRAEVAADLSSAPSEKAQRGDAGCSEEETGRWRAGGRLGEESRERKKGEDGVDAGSKVAHGVSMSRSRSMSSSRGLAAGGPPPASNSGMLAAAAARLVAGAGVGVGG